jgi:outer membrane protein assembly factor BamB
MPTAEQFLRLLEEKELVSPPVLQAARREIERSPSSDAVGLSLWLVQGSHITASQAQRLLAAINVAEPAGRPNVPASQTGKQDVQGSQARKPDVQASQARKPEVRPPEPPRPPKPAPVDDLGFAPLDEGPGSKPGAMKPPVAKTPAPSAGAASAPVPPPVVAGKAASPAAAKIGGELDSLHDTMKGPLDSLIESEGLGGGFDDPLGGPSLHPSAPKKFKLRRFLKNLFRRNKSKVVKVKATDPRHVKMVLFSWGVGVAIVIGLLTAFWFISPPGSTELLQKADEAATAKDYDQAIRSYDDYLRIYPKSPNINDVRWRRGLAVFQLAEKNAVAAGDWKPAFEIAKKEVKALPKDANDGAVAEKLTVALAKIGEGLAQEAKAKPDVAAVERAQDVLNMIDKDLPANARRPDALLDEIQRILTPVRLDVESRHELDTTREAIRAAVDAGDVQTAYSAYRDLLKLYPDLADAERLTDAMKAVSAVQQKAVKISAQTLPATPSDRPSGLLAAMPLAVHPKMGELPGGRGKQVFVVEQGTAYGLDAASGKALWRRFVALDPKRAVVTALPVAGGTGGDVVLCDLTRQEVLRVKGATGELVWRLALPQPIIAAPVQAGKWLLVLTKDRRPNAGQLVLIDLATGESPKSFQLPQAVRLPPVVDPARGLIFLTADQSNLFVLDASQCRQVMHVGHEDGAISVPPAILGDFLLLPVNNSPSEGTIHVFSISKSGNDEPLKALQTLHLPGAIAATPVAWGNGAAVVTKQGGLFALDRSEVGSSLPFQVVASGQVVLSEKSPYPISDGKRFWLADRDLTRYAIRADEHRIAQQESGELGMKFLQAPRIENGAIFLVLKRAELPGATVAAFDPDKNEFIWQTWIAAPLAAEPTLGSPSGKLTIVTASGGMFRVPPEELQRSNSIKPPAAPWEPILTVDPSQLVKPLGSLLPLSGEMFAMTSGAHARQIVIYDPKEQDKHFRFLLTPSKMEMSVAPGLFAGGLLTPCENGQILLLDPEARGQMAKSLPPPIAGANIWNWRRPVAIGDKSAVLSDGDKRLSVVSLVNTEDGGKALTEATTKTSETGLVSPVAALGKVVYVADAANCLRNYELPGLTPREPLALGSRCVWGPFRVGNLVLVATEKNDLIAVDEQKQVWKSALSYGLLSGAPTLLNGEIYLSARSGTVSRISAAEGKELGKMDAGCPLGTGPLVIGSTVLVGGHEGSLLILKRP